MQGKPTARQIVQQMKTAVVEQQNPVTSAVIANEIQSVENDLAVQLSILSHAAMNRNPNRQKQTNWRIRERIRQTEILKFPSSTKIFACSIQEKTTRREY